MTVPDDTAETSAAASRTTLQTKILRIIVIAVLVLVPFTLVGADIGHFAWIITFACVTAIIVLAAVWWKKRRKLRLILIVLLAEAAFIVAGFTSNTCGMRECERRVARWLAEDVMRGEPFYILEEDAAPEMLEVFDSVGAQYVVYRKDDPEPLPQGNCYEGGPFPWANLKPAHSTMPFVISVEWGWVYEPQYGTGHTRRFFCLFGLIIELWDTASGWAT
jgi:hypothetical protein